MSHLEFDQLTLRNFMSFANDTTTISLGGSSITAIIGVNYDMGGEESRNGSGKSSIMDSLAYVLFGKSLRQGGVSNQKLIHKWIKRNEAMVVSLTIRKNNIHYLIERGEKPSILRLFAKPMEDDRDFKTRVDGKSIFDRSRSKPQTTEDIEEIVGFDYVMLQFLVVNGSETQSFMNMDGPTRKDVMERMFGFSVLSERAKTLGEERKALKSNLVALTTEFETNKKANERITLQINDMIKKSNQWRDSTDIKIKELSEQIELLSTVNLEEQADLIEKLGALNELSVENKQQQREISLELQGKTTELNSKRRELDSLKREKQKFETDIASLKKSVCPTCNQHWLSAKDKIVEFEAHVLECNSDIQTVDRAITEAQAVVQEFNKLKDEKLLENKEIMTAINSDEFERLMFDSLDEISKTTSLVNSYVKETDQLKNSENPFNSSIVKLENEAIVELDDTTIKETKDDIAHYDVLIELLTDKESFLRQAIINKWLSGLNSRIQHYLDRLSLPFDIAITGDLSIEIIEDGMEFDWGNLSKGQRQRVTIALNLAFIDLFEIMHDSINLLMVDELIDNGICSLGAEQVLEILEDIAKRKNKHIFIATHRMDIVDRIPESMFVELTDKVSTVRYSNEEDFDVDIHME